MRWLAAVAVLALASPAGARVAGGGPAATDCYAEFDGPGIAATKGTRVECTDGDPACDADGTCEGTCDFLVQVCANQCATPKTVERVEKVKGATLALPSLPATEPACGGLVTVTTRKPKGKKPKPGKAKVSLTAFAAGGGRALGAHHPLDCLIFASGFEFATDYSRRCGFETVGRDGRTLSAHWADGMRSLHGIHVHGFPNLFIVGLTHGANLISNITHNLTDSGTTVAKVIANALETGTETVESTEAAEEAWVALIESGPQGFLGNPDCTPGYYNNEGGPFGRRERLNVSGYPLGPVAFFEYIDQWRRSGRFEGLRFGPGAVAAGNAA